MLSAYSDKVSFAVGEVATLSASGIYSDGSMVDLTSDVSWSCSDETKVTVSSNQATAVAAGVSYISASYEGLSKSIVLIPFKATLTGIELNYQSLSLPGDGEAVLVVNALYDNGSSVNVTSESTFTSSNETIATVSASGVICSQAAGSANIMVDYNGNTKVLPITVTAATIDSIQVTPIVGSKGQGGIIIMRFLS